MLNVSDKFLVSYGILLEWRKQFKRGILHNCPHRPQVLKKRDEEMIKKRNQGREDKKLQALMTKCNHARKWIATRRKAQNENSCHTGRRNFHGWCTTKKNI